MSVLLCFTAPVGIRVERAAREDALVVAAVQLQFDRELGGIPRRGFLTEYADAWLAAYDTHPTWLARRADGDPVGFVVTRAGTRLPSLRRHRDGVLHVAQLFVRPDGRGTGLGERLMREVLDWADRHDVARVSLNSEPAARSLYERLGFAPGERYLELQLDRAVARPA